MRLRAFSSLIPENNVSKRSLIAYREEWDFDVGTCLNARRGQSLWLGLILFSIVVVSLIGE